MQDTENVLIPICCYLWHFEVRSSMVILCLLLSSDLIMLICLLHTIWKLLVFYL